MKTFMQVLLLAIPGLGKFTNLLSCVQFDVCLVATLLGVNSQHADKLKKIVLEDVGLFTDTCTLKVIRFS